MNNTEIKNLPEKLLDLLVLIHNKLLNPNEVIKGCIIPPSHMKVIFYLANKKTMSVSNVAKCLDNNIASQGKTKEEALANLNEALELNSWQI